MKKLIILIILILVILLEFYDKSWADTASSQGGNGKATMTSDSTVDFSSIWQSESSPSAPPPVKPKSNTTDQTAPPPPPPPMYECYFAEQFRGKTVPPLFYHKNIQGIYAKYDCQLSIACSIIAAKGSDGGLNVASIVCPPRAGDVCRVRYNMQTSETIQPDPSCTRQEEQPGFVKDYLKTITLPTPTPVLTPKGAKNPGLRTLCGLRAYLDTGIEGTITYEEKETPFGPLTVKAVPTYRIDWQDKRTGIQEYSEYSSIYHYWENKGTYDITVTVDWEVQWSFAQNSGTIEGLQTQAVVNDYQVLEAYAIITE